MFIYGYIHSIKNLFNVVQATDIKLQK